MTAEPRWATPRSPGRRTCGSQVARMAQLLGRDLMPWQRHLVLLGGELVESDELGGRLIPAFRQVGFTVPRQSGKTTLKQSVAQQRAKGDPWRGPQRMLYSAQTGRAASEKLTEDWFPDFLSRRQLLGVSRLYRGVGKEGIHWSNGSLLGVMSDNPAAGHGKTLHLGLQDELFDDVDDRRDGAMVPAMNTVPDAQVWKTSTAGTRDSATWNAVVARGRLAAERGVTTGQCWVEFSADPQDDPDDPAVWASCMPALGHTISYEAVRHARATLPLAEFMRAFLNIPVGAAADYVFGSGVWERGRVTQRLVGLTPADEPSLAVHVSRDREYAWVVAAVPWARDGVAGVLADVLHEGEGTHWVVASLVEQFERFRQPIRFLGSGMAGSVAAEAAALKVPMVPVPSREFAAGCGGLFDAVTETPVRFWHPANVRLDAAATALEKRASGDAFVWDGASEVDPSPVVAVTLARHATVGTPRGLKFSGDDTGIS